MVGMVTPHEIRGAGNRQQTFAAALRFSDRRRVAPVHPRNPTPAARSRPAHNSHAVEMRAILGPMLLRITRLLIALALLLSACGDDDPLMHAADARPGSIADLAGAYVLNGIDPHGREYTGHLEIRRGANSRNYELQWIVTEAFQEGTGNLKGNTLEIEWQTSDQAALDVAGTASFTVTVEGELYGSKMVDGYDGRWRETAYPVAGR